MVHRYLATGVGVLILVLALASWRARRAARRASRVALVGRRLTLVWVCVQGAFGALTVTHEAVPGHRHAAPARAASVLLALLALQSECATRAAAGAAAGALRGGVLRRGRCCAVLQIALGGWVSTNYAVLACSDFPTCQGQWWPAMDFAHGFALLRDLGDDARRRLPAVRRADRHPLRAPPGGLRACSRRCCAAGLAAASQPVAARRAAWRWLARWRCGSWPAACPTWCWAGRWWPRWRTPAAPRRWCAADRAAGSQRAGPSPSAATAASTRRRSRLP